MPVSAEQWRAATGSLNAGRGLRPRPSIKPPSLCDLPSPPSSSWKGYIAAFIMLCVPLFYKVYVVGVTVMVYLCSGRAPHGVTNGPYPTGVGLSADVSNICLNHYGGMFLFLLNVILYVTMATAVLLAHRRKRDKCQWKLTQQLHHLDLFWLNSGPECEVIFDPTTCSAYATLKMNSEGTDLHCECCTSNPVKRKKNQVNGATFMGVVSLILQLSTLVVAMLLLLAGDVERNPGPVTGSDEVDMADHFKVSQYLEIMEDHQLKQLGGALGLDYTKLSRMNTLPCDMVAAWLREEDNVLATSGHPSWSGLVKALREVGQTGIAEKINREQVQAVTRKRPRSSEEPVSSENELSGQRPSLDGAQGACGVTSNQGGNEQVGASPATKKPKYCFPFLDLSGLSLVEAQARQRKLCRDFDEINEKFDDLRNTITKSLKANKKSVCAIANCVSGHGYGTMEPVYTDLNRPKLRHRIAELEEATSIDKAMIIISEYSSFFNYRLIKRIIENLGTEEDKAELAQYKKHFQKYAERAVFECPLEIGIAHSEERVSLSILVKVHHEGFEGCSVNLLTRFLDDVSKLLDLPIGMLLLESVVPGCLELTLQLPLVVHQTIFPLSSQQEEALAALGVTKISAGDYQYPSCRDEGDSDHKPDDKPDDDAPSDSGFGTLSTVHVLSELSELRQDMIHFDRDTTNPYEIDFEHTCKSGRQSNKKPSLKKKEKSENLLHVAAYLGRLDHVKVLVETKQFSPLQRDQNGNTALHYASHAHHLEVLKYFVEELGCNPTISGAFGETPLHVSARERDLDIVTYLVSEKGVDPMCQGGDCDGTTLHAACIGGNIEVVRFLVNEFKNFLDIKEIVSDKAKYGFASLHLAVAHGHIEIVKYFISEMNCDPSIPGGQYGSTPLHVAATMGHVEIMKYLIDDCKCHPSQVDNEKGTPLHYAASWGHMNAVKFLTEDKCCYPSPKDPDGNTPLHHACRKGHIEIVKYFISELRCDPNIQGNEGRAPLHFAAMGGHVDTMTYLINDQKCDPSQQDDNKFTPLCCAVEKGQLQAVKFLTQLLRDRGRQLSTDFADTPLHRAALHGHLEIVKHFVSDMNTDPNIPDPDGSTPLHVAAHKGHVEIIKCLIDCAKCNPMPLNDNNVTPLHMAAFAGQLEAVKFLTETKQCNPMCRDIRGLTPLHFAAGFAGHKNVVKFYIETLNCPPDVPGPLGATPMKLAAMEDHQDVVKYLQTALLVKSGINFYKKYTHML